jgi:hypothetical protein
MLLLPLLAAAVPVDKMIDGDEKLALQRGAKRREVGTGHTRVE